MTKRFHYLALVPILLLSLGQDLYGRRKKLKRLTLKRKFCGISGRVTKKVAPNQSAPLLKYVQMSFKPIQGSKVFHCETDKSGRYKMALPKGAYFVTASKSGYKTVSTKPAFVRVEGHAIRNFALRRVPGGFRGTVYSKLANGQKGPAIAYAPLNFIKKNSGDVIRTMADPNGRYSTWLQPGAYEVRCKDKRYFRDRVPKRILIAKDEKKRTIDLYFKKKPPRFKLNIGKAYGYIWERTGPYKGDDLLGGLNGVEVVFINKATKAERKVKCSANGNFYEILLPKANYEVILRKVGFMPMAFFTYDVTIDEPRIRFDWYMVKDTRPIIK